MESKVYIVEVGTPTKSGGMVKYHSFACQSKEDHNTVTVHYEKMYSGFVVYVEEVREVLVLEIIVEKEDIFSDENHALKLELAELKKEKQTKTLDMTRLISNFPQETQLINIEMKKYYDMYTDKVDILNEAIKNALMLEYDLIASGITMTKVATGDNASVGFRVNLKGTLNLTTTT